MDLSQPCPAGATSCPTGCTAGATVPCPGEQTVTSPLIVGGLVFFSTNRPIPSVAGSCSTSLGEARGYSVNLLNASGAVNDSGLGCGGSRSNTFAGGGLPPSPVFGQVVISTPSGDVVKPVCIGCISRTDQTNAPIKPSEQKPPINAIRKRLYWYTPGTEN
jgi:type IV pilus assembly protein PilY1